MTTRKTFKVLGTLAVCALVLAACRAEEQGRITDYQPGVYLGKKDTQLSKAQTRQLLLRANQQGSATFRSTGGGGEPTKSNIDLGKLSTRANMQRSVP